MKVNGTKPRNLLGKKCDSEKELAGSSPIAAYDGRERTGAAAPHRIRSHARLPFTTAGWR